MATYKVCFGKACMGRDYPLCNNNDDRQYEMLSYCG